jgi:hypothetical protein
VSFATVGFLVGGFLGYMAGLAVKLVAEESDRRDLVQKEELVPLAWECWKAGRDGVPWPAIERATRAAEAAEPEAAA